MQVVSSAIVCIKSEFQYKLPFKKKQFLDEEFSLKERTILISNPHPRSVYEEYIDPT